VTSGTQSPTLGKAIGMGYVKSSNSSVGDEFYIQIRKNSIKARVVKLPFVD
jgi:aminomethyltransferase